MHSVDFKRKTSEFTAQPEPLLSIAPTPWALFIIIISIFFFTLYGKKEKKMWTIFQLINFREIR